MAGQIGLFVAEDLETGTQPRGARLAASAFIEHAGPGPLDVKLGVFADTMDPVVSGTSDMSYDIRAFVASSRLSASIGPVVSPNDALVNVETDPAPGSNSRWDIIYCHQHLTATDGGSDDDNEFVFGVAIGDPGATPSLPTADVPNGALMLAKVRVFSGTTATNVLTFERLHKWVSARQPSVQKCELVINASQSIPNDVLTKVTGYEIPTVDPTYFSYASGTVTINTAGNFDISADTGFGVDTNRTVGIVIVNGVYLVRQDLESPSAGGHVCVARMAVYLEVGDTVEFHVLQVNGAAQGLETSAGHLCVVYRGA